MLGVVWNLNIQTRDFWYWNTLLAKYSKSSMKQKLYEKWQGARGWHKKFHCESKNIYYPVTLYWKNQSRSLQLLYLKFEQFSKHDQDSSVGSTLDWYLEGPGSKLTVSNWYFNWRKVTGEILCITPLFYKHFIYQEVCQ